MKKWILKAIVQKTISFLPFKHNLNFFFQKYITKGVQLSDEYFYDRLGHAQTHLEGYSKITNKSYPAVCLEIGTGWYPVVPISFFLVGTDKTYSVDISFLTSKERVLTTIEMFLTSYQNGKVQKYLSINPDRLAQLIAIKTEYHSLSFDTILDRLHLKYLIQDARNLSLQSNSIDLVNSNNTFEHIYPDILIPILKEFKRIVKKKGGVMSHFIDMSDHFAHFDKTISIYHFLQYSDKEWSKIDNSIQPQSRLRKMDYQKIYTDLGIPITHETIREGNITEAKEAKLSDKYKNIPLNELAISHCHFLSDMSELEGWVNQ